jgi:hypothetical protein
VATQGLLKSAISVVSNEVKDHFTKGIKEGLSDYIAKDLLDIDNKGNDEQRKKDIKLASDLSAGVSIDMVIGGAYSIVKGSKNVVKADERLNKASIKLKYSNDKKMSKQMRQRGWSEQDIIDAIQTEGIPTVGKNGPATRYVHPKTGKSVVIDNQTGEIFHVGGEGFKYDY